LNSFIVLFTQIGKDARGLIVQLLKKNPSERLGFVNNAEDIKKHRFFGDIDWDQLKARQCKPPISFEFNGLDDCSQFDLEFTTQAAVVKSAEKLPRGQKHFKSK
jgi:hypothetical protein